MLIDCDSCQVREVACSDCVVSVLLGMPPPGAAVELDDAERAAIGVLADSGLVPPLRLVAAAGDVTATGHVMAAGDGTAAGDATAGGTGTYDGRHAGGAACAG